MEISLKVDIGQLIDIIASAQEFEEFPVRHNEDKLNAALSNDVPLKVNSYTFDSPHTKCNLLLQAHFSRIGLPNSDYYTDTKSVLDQCLRIMQSVLDICGENGWLNTSLLVINLMQMVCQGRWIQDSDLLCVPHIETEHLTRFYNNSSYQIDCLPRLIDYVEKHQNVLEDLIGDLVDTNQIKMIYQNLSILPKIEISLKINGPMPFGELVLKNGAKAKKANENKEDINKVKSLKLDAMNPGKVYELFEDEDYVLNLDMRRINRSKSQNGFKAYCAKYHKPKDENWVAILGVHSEDEFSELIGLKRINNFKLSQNSNLSFKTPTIKEMNRFDLTLFFMSDAYLGLDQQFEIKFKLRKKK